MKKHVVLEALDDFEDDLEVEQLVEKLLFIEKVELGMQAVSEGRVLAYEDVKQKFQNKWGK